MNVPARNSIGKVTALAAAFAASSSFTKRAMIIPIPVKHIVPTKRSSRVTTLGTAVTLYTSFATMIIKAVSYTHLRAHETVLDLVCRLLLEKKKKTKSIYKKILIN